MQEFLGNGVLKFSSCLTEKILHLQFKVQLTKAAKLIVDHCEKHMTRALQSKCRD
jgi:hypothetical protein